MLVVDSQGKALSPRVREDTPQPATPEAILGVITRLAKDLPKYHRISAGFPGVVHNGIVLTAPNLDPSWANHNIDAELEKRLGKPALCANDAAVQGLGAIHGKGLELILTLGTGLGCALYKDGLLVTSLELAHHPFRKGKTYEECLGKRALKKDKKQWKRNLKLALQTVEKLFHYDRLFLGGGNAELIDFPLPQNVTITPNEEGLFGGLGLWKGRSV